MTEPTSVEVNGREYGLGRVPSPPDVRDALFPMAVAPALAADPPAYRYWTPGRILDQGSKPHCVGYSWAQWQQTSPLRGPQGNARGDSIYAACKEIDGYAGDGTWVRAGAKVVEDEGLIERYVWAQDEQSLKLWLLTTGPVVVGTAWYQGMFSPDGEGLIRPTGGIAGGHAYLLTGYGRSRGMYRITNSWGRTWGQHGKAWIGERDMWALITNAGEACAAVERRAPAGE